MKDMINKKIERLKNLIPVNSLIGFYPSSGTNIKAFDFSKLPLDYVICSDYNIKEEKIGKIITFKGDNNLCLRVIIESGIKLDAIFAVQDGAIQGGNHEYVNSVGFLGRLLPALKNTFVLVSNIRNYFSFDRGPITQVEYEGIGIYRQAIYSTYDLDVNNYEIKCFNINNVAPHSINITGEKKIRIFRKSIWQDQTKLDAIFKGTRDRGTGDEKIALMEYWPSSYMHDKLFNIFDLTKQGSIIPLLNFCNEKKLNTIGLVPFVAGACVDRRYNRIVRTGYLQLHEEYRDWNEVYPKEIILYHFDSNDFAELYAL